MLWILIPRIVLCSLLCFSLPTALVSASEFRPLIQDAEQEDVPAQEQEHSQEDVLVLRAWDGFAKRCRELERGDLATLGRRVAALESQFEETRSSYEDTVEDLEDAGVDEKACKDMLKGVALALATIKLRRSSAGSSYERRLWSRARSDINRMNNMSEQLENIQEIIDRLRLRLAGPTWPAFVSKNPAPFELATLANSGEVVGTNERGCLVEVEVLVDVLDGRPIKVEKMILLVASGLEGCVRGKVILKRGTVATTRGPVILRIRGEDRPIPLVHLSVLPDALKRNDRGKIAEVLLKSPPGFDGLR